MPKTPFNATTESESTESEPTSVLVTVLWEHAPEIFYIPLEESKVGDLVNTQQDVKTEEKLYEYAAVIEKLDRNSNNIELKLTYNKENNSDYEDSGWLIGTTTLNFENAASTGTADWKSASDDKQYRAEGVGIRLSWFTDAGGEDLVQVLRRRRDSRFKQALLNLGPKACAISGETCEHVLDAAHIHEVKDLGPCSPDNGILLRTDLHRLYDRDLFSISAENGRVILSDKLKGNYREELRGKKLEPSVLKRVRAKLKERNLSRFPD
jgi:hypothetical protein